METPRGCARRGERESQRDKRQEEKEKESERGMRTEGEEGSLFELYYKTNIFQVLWGITIVFWKGLPARAARRSGSRAKLQYSATITTPGWYIISYNFSSLSRLCLAPLNEDKRIGKETWLRIPSPLNLRFIFPLPLTLSFPSVHKIPFFLFLRCDCHSRSAKWMVVRAKSVEVRLRWSHSSLIIKSQLVSTLLIMVHRITRYWIQYFHDSIKFY